MIQSVVNSLERFGKYDFRSDGFVKIERWPARRALDAYRSTLAGIKGKMEGEPPSATMTESVMVQYSTEPAEIGRRVRQRHVGKILDKVRPLVDKWFRAGAPFPSSGGFYWTTPNKSYERVKELTSVPEQRDIVLNLGVEDLWLSFWEKYLPMRHDVSHQLLALVKSRQDPEALSRGNEEAGTGLQVRNMRLKRKDLVNFANDLDFLLPYMFAMGVAFAAVQLAKLSPDSCWVISVYDPRIKGAIASRSDMDVMDVDWNGEYLTLEGVAQTRQAGSDCTGTLANSATEKKLMGASTTEQVVRANKHDRVHYPFTDKNRLLEVWGLDAKRFPGKRYLIGEDLGMVAPVKSPADALFSRAYMMIGGRVMPLMLSGSGWTQAVYSVFHNYFASKLTGDDWMLCLGDDINWVTMTGDPSFFGIYEKVKSTLADKNWKKILGQFSVFGQAEDPFGDLEALIGYVPRNIKTVSSATKRSTAWGESLSNLGMSGTVELIHPPETVEAVQRDIEVLLPYMQWSGPRRELNMRLKDLWTAISTEVWQILVRYNEEIEHRITPEDAELLVSEE
jgi:hypothetical protein